VIPVESGDLGDYMASLERLLAEAPRQIYPAHGPRIDAGVEKIEEYLRHRLAREQQVLDALQAGDRDALSMVRRIYIGYPETLHAAAAQSVTSHLKKLEKTGHVRSEQTAAGHTDWYLASA
jgi:ribonuclease/clavin/mitogillin